MQPTQTGKTRGGLLSRRISCELLHFESSEIAMWCNEWSNGNVKVMLQIIMRVIYIDAGGVAMEDFFPNFRSYTSVTKTQCLMISVKWAKNSPL